MYSNCKYYILDMTGLLPTTFDDLPNEIIMYILKYLSNVHDIISFTSANYRIYNLRCIINFQNIVRYNNIRDLQYSNCFNKCIIDGEFSYNIGVKMMKCIVNGKSNYNTGTEIMYNNLTRLEFRNFKGDISFIINNMKSLRHLCIHDKCQIVLKKIPSHVTHLTWKCGQKIAIIIASFNFRKKCGH